MLLSRVILLAARLRPCVNIARSRSSPTIRLLHAMSDGLNDSYRPYLLPIIPGAEHDAQGPITDDDWTISLDLSRVMALAQDVFASQPLRVLVLYGSLRER